MMSKMTQKVYENIAFLTSLKKKNINNGILNLLYLIYDNYFLLLN